MTVDKELEPAGVGKRREVIRRLFGKKEVPPEIEEIPEIPPEIERAQPVAGAAAQLTQPVTDDQGQVLVTSAAAQQPQIVLPLTGEEIEEGLHQKVFNSVRWLAEWCLRLVKKMGGAVVIKKKKG